MQSLDQQIARRLADAFAQALGRRADQIDPAVRATTDPRFGDYQSNAAMALAKQAGTNPRKLAEQVVAAARLDDLCDPPEIAGPGFINLRLRREFVGGAVAEMAGQERLGVEPAGRPESIVIDFSSPNISKEMHIGHLRSTVLGDVLSRTLEFLGYRIHRQNHVGDWGTQFGMLLAHLKGLLNADPTGARADLALNDLEEFYRQAKSRFDSDPGFAGAARAEVVALQSGDAASLDTWRRFREISLLHCQQMYNRLGVTLAVGDVRGESDYNANLPKVVADLDAKGLLQESEGALCVFVEGFVNKDGNPLPFIVRKSDGAYLYATTDLAALRYRVGHFRADRILYVVDSRQAQHFVYLFAVARKAGFASQNVRLVHIGFGTIQGPDGKPFKTKSGESVKLADVLDEAEQRARKVVEQKNPDLPADQKARVARAVGIGAVKYFDLSNNRVSDYRFDWDQMLALTGNTAPYLQYAYARIRSIFRKGGLADGQSAPAAGAPALAHDAELALAKHLVRFGEIVHRVVEDYRPNILCDYLYALANHFSGFYENCPVLKADEPTRSERLLLSHLTARVLKRGLDLLGIEVLEQM